MPRTTKAKSESEDKVAKTKTTKSKASTTKKAATAKKNDTTTRKTATKKSSTTKASTKKGTTTTKTTKTAKTTKSKASTIEKAPESKANTTKKTSAKASKASATKKTATRTAKTSTAKKATSTKKVTTTKKTASAKKASTAKETAITKKVSATKTSKSSTTAKKATTAAKKSTSVKKVKTARSKDFSIAEYYDLPAVYNKTVVKLLAQTPTTLFVYWNISDDDRNKYIEQYGEKFFEATKPVLIIHNDTMNYSFEVDINDFANCWYLDVNDSKCKYRIELGRRPIRNNIFYNTLKLNQDYVYIDSSNEMESPNDHILFDTNQKTIYFKNVKTNHISSKSINFSYMKQIGKIYNIYDMYKKIYSDELIQEFDLSNPSSGNPSSTFK